MKKLLFIDKGVVTGEHFAYQHNETQKGNHVLFCNGSLKSGFEDNCDVVVMDCVNERVTSWAESKFIDIEYFRDGIKKDDKKEETAVDPEPTSYDYAELDKVFTEQLTKADIPVPVAEQKAFEIPAPADVEPGIYRSPDGKEYEKKKGPKFKGDFEDAIVKFGFENFVKI